MITKRRIAVGLLALLVFWAVLLIRPEGPHNGPRFTISEETTYLTEPLRPDGFVDYVAALNQRASQGVTPENNAVVLLWQAVGPKDISPQYREEYFKLLGVPPVAETGDYLVPFNQFLTAHLPVESVPPKPLVADKQDPIEEEPEGHATPCEKPADLASEQLDKATTQPWSKSEFPMLAEWLATSDRPLALVLEASRRPRYYAPIVGETDGDVGSAFSIGLDQARPAARALIARAMLRLDEGRTDEAWQDLLAVHRLARLVGQDPRLLGAFVAWAIEGNACAGDEALLRHARLGAPEARKMRNDLAALAPMPPLADKFDIGERYWLLDFYSQISRERFDTLHDWLGTPREPSFLIQLILRRVNWDRVLRMANAHCDRLAEACRKPNRQERREALDRISEGFDIQAKGALGMEGVALDLLFLRHRAISDRVGYMILAIFFPATSYSAAIDDRATMRAELTILGFALAEYRAEHGSYPARLADLVPKYVPKVPLDLFNDEELHYQPKDDGYALWSVGMNGIDDGGKNEEDYRESQSSEPWDDLSIRVPGPTKGSHNDTGDLP